MKKSQAFAALRNAVVAELNQEVDTELLPKFNAEVSDIRKVFEEEKPTCEALAMHRRRASIADLVIRRDQFIAECNTRLRTTLEKRVQEYGGQISEVEIDGAKKLEAKFDDNSVARFPRALWINFKAFDRV